MSRKTKQGRRKTTRRRRKRTGWLGALIVEAIAVAALIGWMSFAEDVREANATDSQSAQVSNSVSDTDASNYIQSRLSALFAMTEQR